MAIFCKLVGSEFTAQAKSWWTSIPPQRQEQLVKNVWYPHCDGVTTITDVGGEVEEGTLVLRGKCAKCGGDVARLIEGE